MLSPAGVAVPTVVPPLEQVAGGLDCGPKTLKVIVEVDYHQNFLVGGADRDDVPGRADDRLLEPAFLIRSGETLPSDKPAAAALVE